MTDNQEKMCTDAAMAQWEASTKRTDLSEKDRVRGAIEAYKRQAFAFAVTPALLSIVMGNGANWPNPWQAIDFAPKDGTAILGRQEGTGVIELRWGQDNWGDEGWVDEQQGEHFPDEWLPLSILDAAPADHVVTRVWDEVGMALALLDDSDASAKARSLIRAALESATGCQAPQYLGGSTTPSNSGMKNWNDPVCAPKDGTMLLLLIRQGQDEDDAFTPFEDSREPYETIGFNNLANTQEDRWDFAGWDWQQDCFVTGAGEVVGWLPFGQTPPPPLQMERCE